MSKIIKRVLGVFVSHRLHHTPHFTHCEAFRPAVLNLGSIEPSGSGESVSGSEPQTRLRTTDLDISFPHCSGNGLKHRGHHKYLCYLHINAKHREKVLFFHTLDHSKDCLLFAESGPVRFQQCLHWPTRLEPHKRQNLETC